MDRIVNLSGCQTVSGIDHLFSGCLQCIIKSAVRFHSGSQEYVISRDQPTASSDFRRDTFFFHSKNSGRSIHRNMILADHILIYDMVAVTAASHNLRKHFHDSHVIGRLQRKLHRRLCSNQAASYHHNVSRGTDPILFQGIYRQRHIFPIRTRYRKPRRHRACRNDHPIEFLKILQNRFLLYNFYSMFFHLCDQVLHGIPDIRFKFRERSFVKISAQTPFFKQRHFMAPQSCRIRSLQTSRTASYYRDFSRLFGRMDGKGIFKTQSGIHGTVNGFPDMVAPIQTSLIAADTRRNILRMTFHGLFRPVWVCQKGTSHADKVCLSAGQDLLGKIRLCDGTGSKYRNANFLFNGLCSPYIMTPGNLHGRYLMNHLVVVAAAYINGRTA